MQASQKKFAYQLLILSPPYILCPSSLIDEAIKVLINVAPSSPLIVPSR